MKMFCDFYMSSTFTKKHPSQMFDRLRSSHPELFCKKGVLRNSAKLTGKYLCQSHIFNKVAGWGMQLYQKRDSDTGAFLWNWPNFFKKIFLQNTFGSCFCRVLTTPLYSPLLLVIYSVIYFVHRNKFQVRSRFLVFFYVACPS